MRPSSRPREVVDISVVCSLSVHVVVEVEMPAMTFSSPLTTTPSNPIVNAAPAVKALELPCEDPPPVVCPNRPTPGVPPMLAVMRGGRYGGVPTRAMIATSTGTCFQFPVGVMNAPSPFASPAAMSAFQMESSHSARPTSHVVNVAVTKLYIHTRAE